MASATVSHSFREDEFTWAGTLRYTVTQPDYTASIPSANFSGTGNVYWDTQSLGLMSFDGTATGSGTDRRRIGTTLRDCSSFTLTESGLLDMSIEGSTRTATVDVASSFSSTYSQYTDRTSGSCPAGDPPSIFFGGEPSSYTGVFNPSTHTLAVNYSNTESGVTVVSPASTTAAPSALVWSETANTNFALSVAAVNGEPSLAEEWISVPQPDGFTADNTKLDAKYGKLMIKLTVTGKPPKALAGGVDLSVGGIQVQWASGTTTTAQTQTIPVTGVDGLFGLYWNSREMEATVSDLGAAPSWARFIKVTTTAAGFTESNTADNTAFIALQSFEAKTAPIVTTSQAEMATFNTPETGLLDATDLAQYPNVAVNAFKLNSRLGALVFVSDPRGDFIYDPTVAPALLALPAGATADDTIDFLAIQNGTFIDDAVRPIRVTGVNDPPSVGEDAVTTSEITVREITISALLANDTDVDTGDTVRLLSVDSTSQLGALITLRDNGTIAYDPTNSDLIRTLRQGETRQDAFFYTIVDRLGLESTGQVVVTITGSNDPPQIAPIEPALFPPGATNTITNIRVRDFDTPLSQVALTLTAPSSPLISAGGIAVSGAGENRTAVLTPVPGVTGRVRLTAQATSAAPESGVGTQTMFLIAGTVDDVDLDGVLDSIESSAFGTSDSNGDGITDQSQPYLTALPSAANDLSLRLEAPKSSAFANVAALNAATGIPASTTTPWGGVAYELHTTPGSTVTILFSSNSSATLNSFYLTAPTPGGAAGATTWQWLMWNGTDGARVYADRVEYVVRDGGRGDADGVANGVISGNARPVNTATPWRNPVSFEDVNNNAAVQPLDALLVINFLNSTAPRNLPLTIPFSQSAYPNYLDVSGDNLISPIDALRIINRLNAGAGEAEGVGVGEGVDIGLYGAEGEEPVLGPETTLAADTLESTALAVAAAFNGYGVGSSGMGTGLSVGATAAMNAAGDSSIDPPGTVDPFARAAVAPPVDTPAIASGLDRSVEEIARGRSTADGNQAADSDTDGDPWSASDDTDPHAAHDSVFARWH